MWVVVDVNKLDPLYQKCHIFRSSSWIHTGFYSIWHQDNDSLHVDRKRPSPFFTPFIELRVNITFCNVINLERDKFETRNLANDLAKMQTTQTGWYSLFLGKSIPLSFWERSWAHRTIQVQNRPNSGSFWRVTVQIDCLDDNRSLQGREDDPRVVLNTMK